MTDLEGNQQQQSRKVEAYKVSSNGIRYKRKSVKRGIRCPLCPSSTQWITRHLKQVHKLQSGEVKTLLEDCDTYRRRKVDNLKPRIACPVAGCIARVTHVGNHLRRVHKTTASVVRQKQTYITSNERAQSPDLFDDDVIPPSPDTRHKVDIIWPSTSVLATTATSEMCVDNQTGVASCTEDEMSDNETVAETNGSEIQQPVTITTSSYIEQIVVAFEKHLGSIDGGAKLRPEMYSLSVRQLLSAVGNSLWNLTKENVHSEYVEKMLATGTISVATLRNKLRSLEYFCIFICDILSRDTSDSMATQICENLQNLKKCLPFWRSSLRKKCTIEDVKRRIQDEAEQLVPDDISRYLKSDYAVYAVQLLNKAVGLVSWTPSTYDFTRARNHMLVILAVGNAHRTGVLINFSLSDYSTRKESDDGSVVFSVCHHKTATVHGAATLAISADEAKLLAGYMKIRRLSQFPEASPYVFVNHTGSQMTQSNVASALTSAFGKCGFAERVTCTKLRKVAVTQVHSAHPDKKHDVAARMCHRLATAEKHYRYNEKQSNSVRCSNLLRQTLTQPSTTTSLLRKVVNVEAAEDGTGPESCTPYRKRVWTAEDRDLVKQKFSSFVKREKTPIGDIQRVLNNDVQLREHLESSLGLTGHVLTKAVRDKIRSFFRWSKRVTDI